ncbi:MAG: efflux RND transporter periplasmic adaptor subunit [Planctomycetota bacterium]|nr:efflux RND transporter periplasmic adaptor subunit [Planctomycetota bacterium]
MSHTAKRAWITVVLLAVLGGLVYGGFHIAEVLRRRRAAATEVASGPVTVATARIRLATVEKTTAVTGDIKPLYVVDVVPKMAGRLERLRLPDGTLIEEGTLIRCDPESDKLPVVAVIERAALDAALQQARAALKVAEASQQRAKVLLDDARRDKQRMMKLFDKGVATENERDKALTAYDRCIVELELAKAQVAQAQAAVQQAEVLLAEMTIEAPISGIVIEKYVDEGNMVGPATPLLRIAQTETVKIVGGVSERHLDTLVAGRSEATATVDACPGEEFRGVVHIVGEDVDPATRTADVEIRIPNPQRRLKPGMFARVRLTLRRDVDVPVVPDSALLRQSGRDYVFVIIGSEASRREVKLGLSQGAFHEVVSGLKAGDAVVTRGQRQLQDRQTVNVVEGDGQ